MNARNLLFAVVTAAITLIGALVHARYSQRWGSPIDPQAAAQRLAAAPERIGSWKHLADGEPLSEFIYRELGLAGSISRIYRDQATGQTVSILLMVGSPGPLVRHPPTVCYGNRDNKLIGKPGWINLTDDGSSRLQLLKYERPDSLTGERFFVAYGHSVDGLWDVPGSPRLAYGGDPLLHKVQLLAPIEVGDSEEATQQRLEAFAREFAATVNPLLFSLDPPATPAAANETP